MISHISLHKTGTSFIQKTLVTNRRKLAAVGVTPARGFHPIHGNAAFRATLPKPNKGTFRALRAVVMNSDAIPDDGQKYLMSPDARAAFLDQHTAGNVALCKRYGTDC